VSGIFEPGARSKELDPRSYSVDVRSSELGARCPVGSEEDQELGD